VIRVEQGSRHTRVSSQGAGLNKWATHVPCLSWTFRQHSFVFAAGGTG